MQVTLMYWNLSFSHFRKTFYRLNFQNILVEEDALMRLVRGKYLIKLAGIVDTLL
jgi:hypothetical protein